MQKDGDSVVLFPKSHRAFICNDFWSNGGNNVNGYCYRPFLSEIEYEVAEKIVEDAAAGKDVSGWSEPHDTDRYLGNMPAWVQSGFRAAEVTAYEDLTAEEPVASD